MLKSIYSRQSELARKALKRIRENAGLTQRELCRRLGREHTFISKCELGERRIDLVEFYWICKACNAPAKEAIESLMREFDKIESD